MPSNAGPPGSGSDDLPPHLDPRQGRRRRPERDEPAAGSYDRSYDGARGESAYRSAEADSRPPLPPELDPRGRRAAKARAAAQASGRDWSSVVGDRHSAANGAVLGLRIAVAALSLAVLLGSGFAWATYRNFTSNINRVSLPKSQSSAAAKNIDGSDQNILIVGNDDRSTATAAELKLLGTTADGGTLNTDTMMLLHVPADGRKATVISFPRDSYVAIPGHGMNKLNSAYPDGVADGNGNKAQGVALLQQTIENLTGLSIDHFVQVDLLGFYRISNAIGGVTVCLNAAQNEPNSGINLKKGNNVIKGTQALAFVRQRYGLPNGDLDRIKRQQYFLSAVFRKLASAGTLLNPFRLESLLTAITHSITLDQTLDPLKLAQQMQNLTAGNVNFTTVPLTPQKYATIDGVGSVVQVDTAAIPAFVDNLIGVSTPNAYASAKAVAASAVSVSVLNGSNTDGLATKNSTALNALGFKAAVGDGNQTPIAATTIEYPKGMEGAAKTLAAQVPGAKVVLSTAVTKVTLIIGANNVQVKTLTPATSTSAKATASATASPSSTAVAGVTTAATAGCIN